MHRKIKKITANIDMAISLFKDLELKNELSPEQKEVTIEMLDKMKLVRKELKNIERTSNDKNANIR